MKVYHEIKAGLGDIIANNFLPVNYGQPNERALWLPRMLDARKRNEIRNCGITLGTGNPRASEIFTALGLRVLSASDVEGWTPSSDLTGPAEVLPFPIRQPAVPIPKKFILFSELAGLDDKALHDPAIYRFLKETTGLPIVKVGRHMINRPHTLRNTIPCDIDLTNLTTLPETAWLASRALVVVSGLSFHRVWSSLFSVPVIELCEADIVSQETMDKTVAEYAGGFYGINHQNRWLKWPLQKEELQELLDGHCDRAAVIRPRSSKLVVPPVPPPVIMGTMKGFRPEWSVSPETPKKLLMKLILSNTPPEQFGPDRDSLKHFDLDVEKELHLLDFGAGMLRNSAGLLSTSGRWKVTAYDSPTMLLAGVEHFGLQKYTKSGRLVLCSSWEHVMRQKFDGVLASLVFQHLYKDALQEIAGDLANLTERLYVIGRRGLDGPDGGSVWDVLREMWVATTILDCHTKLPVTESVLYNNGPEDHNIVVFKKRERHEQYQPRP